MKIGIFLGYGPQTVLGKEGLGRYLGTLIKGFQKNGHQILIGVPRWQLDSLTCLFNDFSIDKDNVKLLVTPKEPVLWRLYKKLFKGKRKGRLYRIFLKTYDDMRGLIQWNERKFAESNSISRFALYSLPVIFLSLLFVSLVLILCFLLNLITWIIAPLLIIFVAMMIIFFRRRDIFYKSIKIMAGLLPKSVREKIFSGFIKRIWLDGRILVFRKMEMFEQRRLRLEINKYQEMQDVWFIPSLFWTEPLKINTGTLVFNAPDMVTSEFPFAFAEGGKANTSALENIRTTLKEGKWFITYGSYIRNKLLLDEYDKSPAQVVEIFHANNDLKPYIYIPKEVNIHNNTEKNYTRAFAESLLGKYANVRYIFYSSQTRPHKNILNLIKAFEYLLRKRFIPIKLFVTGSLSKDNTIKKYIIEHSLEKEVISFYNVSAQKLAALYHCADLVVNPTLYEGGFPFTFGEGMSVGTPSVMSDIPQTREVLEPAGLEVIMFDPYDWKAMAEKIEYGLNHREEFYQKELPLYQKMAKHTPEVEAAEYVEAFKYFIAQEAATKA